MLITLMLLAMIAGLAAGLAASLAHLKQTSQQHDALACMLTAMTSRATLAHATLAPPPFNANLYITAASLVPGSTSRTSLMSMTSRAGYRPPSWRSWSATR